MPPCRQMSWFRFAVAFALVASAAAPAPTLREPTTHGTTGRSVTFGIESEFKPEGRALGLIDENTMRVDLSRVPFAYGRGSREDRRGAGSSNNLEINGLPVSSLEESLGQMR